MRLVCLFIYLALAEMLLLAASVWHGLTAGLPATVGSPVITPDERAELADK